MSHAPTSFARVYEEHVWRIYGFLAYRLRDREAAEDLTQATFERALRAWGRFDPRRGSEATWLLAIARNQLIDYHRRDRSDRLVVIDADKLPASASPEPGGALAEELAAALAELSERDREVIALRFGADLTGPQIAQLLGLTLANVHQIISRSLRRLKEQLDPAPPRVLERD